MRARTEFDGMDEQENDIVDLKSQNSTFILSNRIEREFGMRVTYKDSSPSLEPKKLHADKIKVFNFS